MSNLDHDNGFDADAANTELRRFALAHRQEPVTLPSGQSITVTRDYGAMVSDKIYHVVLDGKQVADARLYGAHLHMTDHGRGEAFVSRVLVDPDARRAGIATALYDVIAADLARVDADLVPSQTGTLSKDAKAFWTDRLGGTTPEQFHHDQFMAAYGDAIARYHRRSWLSRFADWIFRR